MRIGTTASLIPDPRGVEAMTDGAVLVADAANHLVLWIRSDGQVLWSDSTATDPALQTPVCARRVSNSSFLIVDRAADRVFIVGLNDSLLWQYGTTGVAGSGVNQLDSPTYADVRPDGNIAICDAGNNRVIVVRKSDYQVWVGQLRVQGRKHPLAVRYDRLVRLRC